MKSFKTFLSEQNNLERQIFKEPPSKFGQTPIYNQITKRGIPLEFNHNDVQSSYRGPREQTVHTSDGAWDATTLGTKSLKETKNNSIPYKKGYTFKGYFSIADTHKPEVVKKFGAAIPDLHSRLHAVAEHFGTSFQFKVPKHAQSFGEHTDSIVVHHYDMPDSSLSNSVHATVHKWASDNGLQLLNRQGMDNGVDFDDKSFSDHLATAIHSGETGSLSQIGSNMVQRAVDDIRKNK